MLREIRSQNITFCIYDPVHNKPQRFHLKSSDKCFQQSENTPNQHTKTNRISALMVNILNNKLRRQNSAHPRHKNKMPENALAKEMSKLLKLSDILEKI